MNIVEQYPFYKDRGKMEKVFMTIGKQLLQEVDEVGLSEGFNSRSATLRNLIEAGLKDFKQKKQ